MKKMIATCGLDCSICGAYLAHKNNDTDLRIKTAFEWSQIYQSDIKPEDINCTGCREHGVKFSHCNECNIRSCAIGKNFNTCAECPDHPCSTLKDFFNMVSEARTNLDELSEREDSD